jgi:hypothetical protein
MKMLQYLLNFNTSNEALSEALTLPRKSENLRRTCMRRLTHASTTRLWLPVAVQAPVQGCVYFLKKKRVLCK